MIEISVVIPTHDRRPALQRVLASLSAQSLPRDRWEVIVVDDGSTDDTTPWLEALEAPITVHHVRQENGGAGRARNRGAELAAGRVLLFLDDDIDAKPGLLEAHLTALDADPGVVGLGYIGLRYAGRQPAFGRFWDSYWEEHYARLRDDPDSPTWAACFAGNLSMTRAAFVAVGGFAEDLARYEDIDIGFRLSEAGYRFRYLDAAAGVQVDAKDAREFGSVFERAGQAAPDLYRRHPSMLPGLMLGAYSTARLRERIVRGVLLRFGAPVWPIRLADPVLSRTRGIRSWYWFVARYHYWRGVKRSVHRDTWGRLTSGPIILCYHAFGSDDEPASRYVLPRRAFARQLRWLRARRHPILALEDYLAMRQEFLLPPAGSVVITIDDGYADLATVEPMLVRARVPATVFAVTERVGTTNDWDTGTATAGRALLDWDGLRRLDAAGIRVEAHGRHHLDSTALDPAVLQDEVGGSFADLQRELGRPPRAFAYPFGRFDEAAMAVVSSAGFEAGLSTQPRRNGPHEPDAALRRTEVHGTDSLLMFALRVWLGSVPLRDRGSRPVVIAGEPSETPDRAGP